MKNLFTFLLAIASVTMLSAQIQKGSVLLGGTVGFNNISVDGNSVTVVNISPSAGFFLNNRFAIGSSLDFSLLFNDGGSNSTTLGLVPFARYYFNGAGKARIFGQADAGFQVDFSDGSSGDPLGVFGLSIGADFFLNDYVAIEATLGYQRQQDFQAEAGLNNIGLNIGVSAFIGGGKE